MKNPLYILLAIFSTCSIKAQQTDTLLFDIGTQWTYERTEYVGPGAVIYDYVTPQIMDTSRVDGHKVFEFSNTHKFYYEDGKMYFWDTYFNDFILYYDFKATQSYTIPYWDISRQEEKVAEVAIDSITNTIVGSDTISLYHFSVFDQETGEELNGFSVYENIGASYYGIRVELGCGLCDSKTITTELRCFENKEVSYNFVGYACDSTFFTTPNPTVEIDTENITIYPNPTSDNISIQGIDHEISFEVYASTGQLISRGSTFNKQISLSQTGFLILKLKINDQWLTKKIIKID